MDNQRNIILALVLSALLLFGWPALMNRFFPQPKPTPTATQTTSAQPAANQPAAGSGSVPATSTAAQAGQATGAAATNPNAAPAQESHPKSGIALKAALATPGRIEINAPEVEGSINPVGAQVDSIQLKTHRQTVAKNSGPVRIFAPAGTKDQEYAQFGWDNAGSTNVKVPTADTHWQGGGVLTQKHPVTLTWDNGEGQLFALTFSIDNHYMLTVRQDVTNKGANPISLRPYAFVKRTSANADPSSWELHSGPIAALNDKVDFGWSYKDVSKDGSAKLDGKTDWIGFTDIYWMATVIAQKGAHATGVFRHTSGDLYRADLLYQPANVAAGGTLTRTTRLFAGAKESKVLSLYQDQGVAKFGNSIDWGYFRVIAWPMWQVLIFLFGVFGNFGVAIICLTVIVRMLMFPVAQKQFASMAQMRAVQPKMKALQQRYKDDKPKLQEEMAKLYKEEKINPLAGCLPMFLQVPIFFALYKTLRVTIEMRHQPFVWWIKDLSAPDPTHVLNLFGLLPFTPPHILSFGVLAVLLGITMSLQFRLNPAAMDPTQQQIFKFMPWVMMIIMAPFAAGLLLYWITSNLLTLAQQQYLYSRHPQLRASMAKDREDKAREHERKKAKG